MCNLKSYHCIKKIEISLNSANDKRIVSDLI